MEEAIKTDWNNRLKDWILWPLLGAMVLTAIFDWNNVKKGGITETFDTLFISFVFWTLLANGNSWVICQLDKRWGWIEYPMKRGILTVLSIFSFTVILSTVIIAIYVPLFFDYTLTQIIEEGFFLNLLITPLAITAALTLFSHIRSFLLSWRQAAINVERLKTENLKSRFETLRNQVNPHFLFNSLNALTSLVYSDQEKAEKFIHKLSDVYRYLLEHQNEETISLKTELEFLNSFVYLNKIRFGNNLEVEINNSRNPGDNLEVPPVVTQMLVENCLKHNEISSDRKLKISVDIEGDKLSVSNNINPLTSQKEISSGVGLENIKSRYKMLSDQPVEIMQTDTEFIVTIPLLKIN